MPLFWPTNASLVCLQGIPKVSFLFISGESRLRNLFRFLLEEVGTRFSGLLLAWSATTNFLIQTMLKSLSLCSAGAAWAVLGQKKIIKRLRIQTKRC